MKQTAFKSRSLRAFGTALALVLASASTAQTVSDGAVPDTGGLNIPSNLQIFGKVDPNVRKATAIVNETVITGTDVDQRVALIEAANNTKIAGEERDRLKLQVLRQLIDETLQIQEAKSADISITSAEMTQSFNRVAANFKQTPEQFREFLRRSGSSERSMMRQIEGELAWTRYLRRRVEPFVNVGETEVKAILDRLESAKGTTEYNLREIYLSASPERENEILANARRIMAELQKGQQPFEAFARNFSEATTRSTGGDLGWVRPDTLPTEIAQAVAEMQPGQVAGPVAVPGGFSILFLSDRRQILTADPRDARLALKQLTVRFPAGLSREQATARASDFARETQALRGCGTVDAVARRLNAEVVDNDSITIRQLPAQLQDILLQMQIGQSTPPFGNPEDGVRALVLCGRDDPRAGQLPSAEQVQNQVEQTRVNLRALQKLRDLRRDAVVEYR